jgi:hypothetical protein
MTRQRLTRFVSAAVAAVVLLTLALEASAWQEQAKRKVGYTDTPMQPYGKWRVHDGTRPQPPIVTPGTCSTQEAPGKAPSDALVLFDGKDLSKWRGGGKIEDGALVIGGGSPTTRDEFGDCQLHVEFATPDPPKGTDQGRGNSGVMLFGRYEFQVLDSFESITYPDGQAAAIYGQYPPLVNASRRPGQWQAYDIFFTAPRFTNDGAVQTPAYVTLIHNGVLVHNHTALLGAVAFRAVAKYSPHGPKGPITLQDHGNPVRFRNIWIREIKEYDQP